MGTISRLSLFFISVLIIACSANRSSRQSIDQGVKGVVAEAVGNQMPSPDRKPDGPKPIKTAIYVYELTNMSQVTREGNEPFYSAINTKLVKTVESDKEGRFAIELPQGSYSLFTKVDGKFYANLFDGKNNIQPVIVATNKVTELNITISAKAFY